MELVQHVCLECHGSYHPTCNFVRSAWGQKARWRKRKNPDDRKKALAKRRATKIPKKERREPFGETPFRYRMTDGA